MLGALETIRPSSDLIMANTISGKMTVSSATTPDWSVIPSKGMAKRSDSEIIEDIKKLASEQAKTHDADRLKQIDDKKIKLRAEYISDVSPDRRSLYRQAENTARKQGLSAKTRAIGGKDTLLYFLDMADGLNTDKDLASKRFSLSGGAYVTFPALTTGGFGINVYSQGKNVLSNLGDGWTYEMTPEEWNKGQKFYSIYNSTLKTVSDDHADGMVTADGIIPEQSRFDISM